MTDNIFLPEEKNIYITEPVQEDKARALSAKRRDAAWLAVVAGLEGSDAEHKMASIEHEVLSTGSSAELEQLRSAMSQQSSVEAQNEITRIITSDAPVTDIVNSLREVRDRAPLTTIEDYHLAEEQKKDSQYLAPLSAIRERERSGGFLYKEEVDADPVFAEAAKQIFNKKEGKTFDGGQIDAVEYGRKLIRELTNPTSMVETPFLLDNEDDALAFMYLLSVMDAQEHTVGGFFKNIAAMASDPVNLLSAAMSFGLAPLATKLGAKKLISKGLQKTLLDLDKKLASRKFLAAEGAVYGSSINLTQQNVEKQAGFRQKLSASEAAVGAAVGGTIGFLAPSIPGAAVSSYDYLTKKSSAWFDKVPPIAKLRQASPKAGRAATKANIANPNPAMGEAPEESVSAIIPSSSVRAGPSIRSEWERLVDQYPALIKYLSEKDVEGAKETLLGKYTKFAKSGSRAVREDKSRVELSGDKLTTTISIGESQDLGYTRMHDVWHNLNELKDKIPIKHEITVFSRQGNSQQDFKEITREEFSAIINSELNNTNKTGEYFIGLKFTDYAEDHQAIAGLWYDEMSQGMTGIAARLGNYGAQRGEAFFAPYAYLANAQSAVKKILEYPLTELRSLEPAKQRAVLKAIRDGEGTGNDFMTRQEALVHFDGDASLADAYTGISQLSGVLHNIYDAPLVKQAQKDGYWRYTFGDSNIIAKEADKEILDGAKQGADLSTGNLVSVDEIRKRLKNEDSKIFLLYNPASVDKAVVNIGVISNDVKMTKTIVTSVLSKKGNYIPGVRKAAYKVSRISNGHTFNGNPVEANKFLKTLEGQKALTVALSNSEADALQWIAKQDNPSEYVVAKTRETGDLDTHMDLGYPINTKGIIYGSRADTQIETINGAGELADVFSSLEYATTRASSMMTERRLSTFHENKWINTFGRPGQPYPRNKDQLKQNISGIHLSKEEQNKAIVAWEGIEAQRRFREDAMSRWIDSKMMWLSELAGKAKLTPLANLLGKQVATGSPLSQTATTVAFYSQVVFSPAGWLLNSVASTANTLTSLIVGPKVFARTVRDLTKALSGEDKVLLAQLRKSGLLTSVNQHDLQQHIVPIVSRESEVKHGILNTMKAKAKAFVGGVKGITFDTPEQMNKASAFIAHRQIYMAETGKAAKELTDSDLVTIVARADVLTSSMSGAGRIPITNIPPLNLLMQYAGYSYKGASYLLSGIPGASKLPFAQKVIPAKYARRALLSYIATFGTAGIGSDAVYERYRTSLGVEPDSPADIFFRNGIFGVTMNFASEALDNSVFSDDDKEVDLAWSQRAAQFGDSGLDMLIKPWDFVLNTIMGDDNPLEAMSKFPVAGLAGSTLDAYRFVSDLYGGNFTEENLANDEKAALAFQEMLRASTVGTKNIGRAWLAFNTGKLYDSLGRENIGGVPKTTALATLFGVQPHELLQMYETGRVINSINGVKSFSQKDMQEVAKEHFDRIERIIRSAHANGYTLDDIGAHLRAANAILEMSVPDNQRIEARNAYLRMVNGEVGRSRADRIRQSISAMIMSDTYSEDMINAIKALPKNSSFSEEEKEMWLTNIKARLEADSKLVESYK